MKKTSLKRFSVSLKGVPKDEVDSALETLLNSFEVVSVVIRKQSREGKGAEGGDSC